jgi:hypothetical protein
MTDEKTLGVVGGGGGGSFDFNDGVLTARDDETVRAVLGGRIEGNGVDVFGPTAQEGCLIFWRGRLGSPPYTDGAVSRGGEDDVGGGEGDGSDLGVLDDVPQDGRQCLWGKISYIGFVTDQLRR